MNTMEWVMNQCRTEGKKQGIEYACNVLEGLLETGVNPKYNLSDLLRLKTNLIDKSQVRENTKK